MSEYDANLGMEIHELLKGLGLETPMGDSGFDPRPDRIEEWFTAIMQFGLWLNLNNDSLKGTPKRVAKMFCHEIFYGLDYKKFPACTMNENTMNYNEIIKVEDISVMSMCEHHFLPFVGRATIGYIPSTKILGLSKFNRIVDFFSRRPQVQERLTEQVSAALKYILQTDDVAVVIKAEHMCVRLRGVQDTGSSTATSKMSGRFIKNPDPLGEFQRLP